MSGVQVLHIVLQNFYYGVRLSEESHLCILLYSLFSSSGGFASWYFLRADKRWCFSTDLWWDWVGGEGGSWCCWWEGQTGLWGRQCEVTRDVAGPLGGFMSV